MYPGGTTAVSTFLVAEAIYRHSATVLVRHHQQCRVGRDVLRVDEQQYLGAENAGVVLSRQRLLELVWGYDFDVDTNVADVFISYLRRKLERDGLRRVIHTVRGIGYVLRDER